MPTADRHHGTRLQLRAIGVQFNWTLNQGIVFSAALTGKPRRMQHFTQYCWKRCVVGTKSDYSHALNKIEWQEALLHGDLPSFGKDPMIFSPARIYLASHLPQLRATARGMDSTKAWRIEGIC